MKLHPSQRSALAERICKRLIARRKLRLKCPQVYVIVHPKSGNATWGMCTTWYWAGKPYGRARITLHMGPEATRRDKYILLVHELTHSIVNQTTAKKYRPQHHGERFQRVLWGTMPRGLWKRATNERWGTGVAGHDPQYQPNRELQAAA